MWSSTTGLGPNLERVTNGKEILKDQHVLAQCQNAEHPRDAEKREENNGGLDA